MRDDISMRNKRKFLHVVARLEIFGFEFFFQIFIPRGNEQRDFPDSPTESAELLRILKMIIYS